MNRHSGTLPRPSAIAALGAPGRAARPPLRGLGRWPNVQAACRLVEATGGRASIGALAEAAAIVHDPRAGGRPSLGRVGRAPRPPLGHHLGDLVAEELE